jgi:hypothetical protein
MHWLYFSRTVVNVALLAPPASGDAVRLRSPSLIELLADDVVPVPEPLVELPDEAVRSVLDVIALGCAVVEADSDVLVLPVVSERAVTEEDLPVPVAWVPLALPVPVEVALDCELGPLPDALPDPV